MNNNNINQFPSTLSTISQIAATEIILTLGQAFEVAYQLAMKMKTRTSTSSLSPSLRRLVEDQDDGRLRETTITS